MYEAVRQRARFSTQATGLSVTLLVTVLAGYVAVTGLGARIVQAVAPPTMLATLPPPATPPEDLVQPKFDAKNIDITLPVPLPPIPIPDNFFTDNPPVIIARNDVIERPPPVIPAHVAVRIAPKIKPTEKPPYPAASRRAQEEGTTALAVCIDAKGRVASASLARSSGHVRLDEAALVWVRDARFTPGRLDGAPSPVCGHPVEYIWKLAAGDN